MRIVFPMHDAIFVDYRYITKLTSSLLNYNLSAYYSHISILFHGTVHRIFFSVNIFVFNIFGLRIPDVFVAHTQAPKITFFSRKATARTFFQDLAARPGTSRGVPALFSRFKDKAFPASRLPLRPMPSGADPVLPGGLHLFSGRGVVSCFCICFFNELSAVFPARKYLSVSGMSVRDRLCLSRQAFLPRSGTCGPVAAPRYMVRDMRCVSATSLFDGSRDAMLGVSMLRDAKHGVSTSRKRGV